MSANKTPLVPKNILIPFILLTSCFAWWGLANNMTDTLLAFFKRCMSMTDFQTSWIQLAFYGAYFCLAIPAALIVQRFTYKVGVLFGLGMFALGGLLFYPASITMQYSHFLIALYILAGGCSILETSANPYILAMGPAETATRRLNLAQSFNPIGSILGVLMSSWFILSNLKQLDKDDRSILTQISPEHLNNLQVGELQGAMGTYVGVSILLIVVWIAILICKMPACSAQPVDKGIAKNLWNFISIPFDAFHLGEGSFFREFKGILRHRNYLWGVIAQFFYVGAQICVWSYTIRYVMQEIHIQEGSAAIYYSYALYLFVGMRFVCTFLMKYISPNMLLVAMSVLAILFCLPVMFVGGMIGVICLVSISGCMSLMFPTIYGIASEGLGEKMKIGGSGLIMAILGGALITAVMGFVSDKTSIQFSYIVPAICFIVTAYFGLMTEKGTVYANGKTSMPKIPGALIVILVLCTVASVGLCVVKGGHQQSATIVEKLDTQAIKETSTGRLEGHYTCADESGKATLALDFIHSKAKKKDGEFHGVIRSYSITKQTDENGIITENVTYQDIACCDAKGETITVEWMVSGETEAPVEGTDGKTVTWKGKTYAK